MLRFSSKPVENLFSELQKLLSSRVCTEPQIQTRETALSREQIVALNTKHPDWYIPSTEPRDEDWITLRYDEETVYLTRLI